jgi:hypothetical protein
MYCEHFAITQHSSKSTGFVLALIAMSTQTHSVTRTRKLSIIGQPEDWTLRSSRQTKIPLSEGSYQIEEKEPARSQVPFPSTFSVLTHSTLWAFWALYFFQRWPGAYKLASGWHWVIYLCEAAFVINDLQTAFELTLSLFGPKDYFTWPQYVLKGRHAPQVHVLVTFDFPIDLFQARTR